MNRRGAKTAKVFMLWCGLFLFVFQCNKEYPDDPLFSRQWYLHNQRYTGEDINWMPVYRQRITGRGVRVSIVGDGFDTRHPELKNRLKDTGHASRLQFPNTGIHGTPMAGLVAATCDNGLGICGVAPGSELIYNDLLLWPDNQKQGLKNLVKSIGDDAAKCDISINSWGGEDFTGQYQSVDTPDTLVWRKAMEDALNKGRTGRGIIFIWSGGNGTNKNHEIDNSNYDGQANFYGSIAVCAVDKKGHRSAYSEGGANLWVCAPSSSAPNPGSLEPILTTGNFGGTSAAAALVGGVVALMLETNPDLTWRDVKMVLARSARKNDPQDPDWQKNGAGFFANHNYGFGVVDAASAVKLAKNWQALPALKVFTTSPMSSIQNEILVKNSGIHFIEFVDVFLETGHDSLPNKMDTSETTITLVSPSGTKSILHEPHECRRNLKKVPCEIPAKWRYGSARNLGENPEGSWQLAIETGKEEKKTEHVKAQWSSQWSAQWSIKIYGH